MNSFDDFEIRSESSNAIFGLCDSTDNEEPAYLAEENGAAWIATVHNVHQEEVLFFPIDHCNLIPDLADGRTSKQCDGLLKYEDSVAFVELKSRNDNEARKWINEATEQLKTTIDFFMQFEFLSEIPNKRAYIANSMKPRVHSSQAMRAEKFAEETGFLLKIQAHISTDERFSRVSKR